MAHVVPVDELLGRTSQASHQHRFPWRERHYCRVFRTRKRGNEVLPAFHDLLHLQVGAEYQLPAPPGRVLGKQTRVGRSRRWRVERSQKDQELIQLHNSENQVHTVSNPGNRGGRGEMGTGQAVQSGRGVLTGWRGKMEVQHTAKCRIPWRLRAGSCSASEQKIG